MGALLAALRPVLVVMLVGGAATAAVAPAFDMASASRAQSQALSPAKHDPTPTPNPDDPHDGDKPAMPEPSKAPKVDFESLLRACLETRDPHSVECMDAQVASGLGPEDFRAKIVAKLATPHPEPKHTDAPKVEPVHKVEPTKKPETVATKPQSSFDTLLKACLETRDANSDHCFRAGQASGLSQADWDAKLRGKLGAQRANDFATWFEKCLGTKNFDSDECIRAEELSGLSTADFKAKFDAKLAAKSGDDFWTVFNKCLETRNVNGDVCAKAQQLIGFNDADFRAKFERYLADKDAQVTKTTAKPLTVSDALLKACVDTKSRASQSCLEAQIASGIAAAEFWAKLEARFGRFN
jgi:hypothetical protein